MDDVGAHLASDTSAGLSAAEMAHLSRLLADPAVWAEAGVDLPGRIVNAITAAAHGEDPADPPAASSPVAAGGGRRRWRRSAYSIVAIAAAIVVALGLAVGLSGDHQHSPLRYTVALHGTGLAPDASGHATLTKTSSGWEIYLDAQGLPRRAGAACYGAWLRNRDGVLVPIGTFNEAKDVRLWAGAPPTAFPILTVTRQRVGDQASSGEVVVTGTVTTTP
jgi:Anti-sigma-K factor rskA